MAHIDPEQLMTELGANPNEHWTHAGETFDSIGWIGDPIFTEEQFNTKKAELLISHPLADPPE